MSEPRERYQEPMEPRGKTTREPFTLAFNGRLSKEEEKMRQVLAKELRCKICKRTLNVPSDPTTRDCGGDCLQCMADAGDPDCQQQIMALRKKRKRK